MNQATISPVRKMLVRWAIILAVIVVLLFFKLVVVELSYWGAHASVQDTDFVDVWAAGALAITGHAAQAYDWRIHHQAEVSALGHTLPGYYGWLYPPIFFFAAAALALVPYIYAWLLWVVVTFVLYLRMVRQIIGEKIAYLFAFAWPPLAWNAYLGQNGLITATLLGGALYHLDKRPKLAGVFFGLLTYKPQFGLIIPFILLIERRWQTIVFATVTTCLLVVLSGAVFGIDSWVAFFHSMSTSNDEVFLHGNADLAKMHSLLGILRSHGVTMPLSWGLQVGWMAIVIAAVVCIRRRSPSFEIKSAALALGVLMASPYLYIYDLAALTVSLAFILVLILRQDQLKNTDLALLLSIILLPLLFPMTGITLQLGFAAMLLTGVLIYQLWRQEVTRLPLCP